MVLAGMLLTADHHIVAATCRRNANIKGGPGDYHSSKSETRPHQPLKASLFADEHDDWAARTVKSRNGLLMPGLS
jgi:hypothetical protein